ncbi:MAG: GDCCVxC domain-containing (seleno)protein [Rubricoccaceae bacterium]
MTTSSGSASVRWHATLTCPACGTAARVEMPEGACQFFWDCAACGTVLRPRAGACCVFCSYADTPCPPVQQGQRCG